jgi:hypothetical protein
MRKFTKKGIKVNVCTDINEWAKKFYGMKKGEQIANIKEVTKECMGFAEPDTNQIWIFIPKLFNLYDLNRTIAHEVGHLMTLPEDEPETKAEHYESYFDLVNEIIVRVYNILE